MKLILTVVTATTSHIDNGLFTFCLVTEHEVPEGTNLKEFLLEKIRESTAHPKSRKNIMSVCHSFLP